VTCTVYGGTLYVVGFRVGDDNHIHGSMGFDTINLVSSALASLVARTIIIINIRQQPASK
jgi:hypothetical protein